MGSDTPLFFRLSFEGIWSQILTFFAPFFNTISCNFVVVVVVLDLKEDKVEGTIFSVHVFFVFFSLHIASLFFRINSSFFSLKSDEEKLCYGISFTYLGHFLPVFLDSLYLP